MLEIRIGFGIVFLFNTAIYFYNRMSENLLLAVIGLSVLIISFF